MTQLGSVPAWMKPQQGGAAATLWANLSRFPMRMGAARMDVAGARTTLRSLALTISEDGPCIKRVGPWGFADTLITDTQPTPTVDGWYPDPRSFVSPYPEQMAWVFQKSFQPRGTCLSTGSGRRSSLGEWVTLETLS